MCSMIRTAHTATFIDHSGARIVYTWVAELVFGELFFVPGAFGVAEVTLKTAASSSLRCTKPCNYSEAWPIVRRQSCSGSS